MYCTSGMKIILKNELLLNFMVVLNIDGEGSLQAGDCKSRYKDLYAKSGGTVLIICK